MNRNSYRNTLLATEYLLASALDSGAPVWDVKFAGSPRSFRNGGTPTGAAAAKRAARKRRNIRKHPRGARRIRPSECICGGCGMSECRWNSRLGGRDG